MLFAAALSEQMRDLAAYLKPKLLHPLCRPTLVEAGGIYKYGLADVALPPVRPITDLKAKRGECRLPEFGRAVG